MSKPYFCKCPRCGEDRRLGTEVDVVRRGALEGLFLLLFGGFLVWFVTGLDSKERKIQCMKCGYRFRRPGLPTSGVTWMGYCVWWVMVLSVIAGMLGVLNVRWLEETWVWAVVGPVSVFIAANPAAFAIGMLMCVILFFVLGMVMVVVGGRVQRERLSERYRLGWPDGSGVDKPNPSSPPTTSHTVDDHERAGTAGV